MGREAALAVDLAFDLPCPVNQRLNAGLAQWATRQDAGLAAPGHGWPMAAGPRSKAGVKACRALARHRMEGIRALGYLALFQVTRCKSGTYVSHDTRNGYVHLPKI